MPTSCTEVEMTPETEKMSVACTEGETMPETRIDSRGGPIVEGPVSGDTDNFQ